MYEVVYDLEISMQHNYRVSRLAKIQGSSKRHGDNHKLCVSIDVLLYPIMVTLHTTTTYTQLVDWMDDCVFIA